MEAHQVVVSSPQFLAGLPDHGLFKDGLLIAMNVIEHSDTKEAMLEQLNRIYLAYEERLQQERREFLAESLGLWGIAC